MTKKQVMPIEQAETELIELFNAMSIDTDVDSMLEDDRKDFESKLRTLARPIANGQAIIDGESYVLTLKKALGDEKTITISEPTGNAWAQMDKAGKNQEMKKLMMFVSGFTGVPYAQIGKLVNSDVKILKEFALLFLV